MLEPISVASTEYIKVPVFARDSTGIINPTADVVKFTFPAAEIPITTGTTWTTGTWETVVLNGTTVYKARCLIGPTGGALVVPIGSWDVWVQITHGLEVVARKAGQIKIT